MKKKRRTSPTAVEPNPDATFPIVAVGASAGGLGLRLDARKVHLEESGAPMILLVISERLGKA